MASYYADHPLNPANNRWDRHSRTYPDYADPYRNSRGHGPRRSHNNELVRPQDDSEESYVEEVHRDFPPGSYGGGYRPGYASYAGPPPAHDPYYERRRTVVEPSYRRRARSVGGRRGDYHYPYDDDDYRYSRHHKSRRKCHTLPSILLMPY